MNNPFIKITVLSALIITITSLQQKISCMEFPKAELAAYSASFKNLSDKDLILKYQQELDNLRQTFSEKTAQVNNPDISQLPVFKTAVFKALIKEIKNREIRMKKSLLPAEQLQAADKLIKEEEARMKPIKKHTSK